MEFFADILKISRVEKLSNRQGTYVLSLGLTICTLFRKRINESEKLNILQFISLSHIAVFLHIENLIGLEWYSPVSLDVCGMQKLVESTVSFVFRDFDVPALQLHACIHNSIYARWPILWCFINNLLHDVSFHNVVAGFLSHVGTNPLFRLTQFY